MAKRSPKGWTIDTLAEHIASRIASLETRFVELSSEREERNKERFSATKTSVEAALASSDRAVQKAEQATEKRFESVNEFRQTLQDQSASFLPRNEYTVSYKSLEEKIEVILGNLVELSKGQVGSRAKSEGLGIAGTITLAMFAILSSIAAVTGALVAILK